MKKADNKYIADEEVEFLGAPIGHNFEEPENQVAGYESINVELLSGTNYCDWVKAAVYASLVTWDTTPQVPITKLLEKTYGEQEKLLMSMLDKRPISVALEGAVFTFKLDGIPRALTHQIVRHRSMSFGQQSYRVSSCYSDPVRIPNELNKHNNGTDILKYKKSNLYDKYVNHVKNGRQLYKEMIDEGVPMEQARAIMPMGTCTKIAVTMRLREMIDYFKGRTSEIAQDEHTYLVCLMAKEMKEKQPEFFKFITKKVPNLEKVMGEYNVN